MSLVKSSKSAKLMVEAIKQFVFLQNWQLKYQISVKVIYKILQPSEDWNINKMQYG